MKLLRSRWVVIPTIVVAAGCGALAARVRPHTYPPDFRYIEKEQLHSVMWRLGADAHALDSLMRESPTRDGQSLVQARHLLTRMLLASAELEKEGRRTNHRLIDAHLGHFRADLKRAQRALDADPPDYFFVGTVTGACVYCHRPGGA